MHLEEVWHEWLGTSAGYGSSDRWTHQLKVKHASVRLLLLGKVSTSVSGRLAALLSSKEILLQRKSDQPLLQ